MKANPGAVRFDPLAEADLSAMLDIYNYYVLQTTATFHEQAQDLAGMRSIACHADPRYRTWVIRRQENIVGYVLLTQFKSRSAYAATAEVTVYLQPDQTGQGIGRLAIGHVETAAREIGFHALVAGITGTNTASLGLFAACGYEKVAHYREVGRKFGAWLDVVYYEKII